MQTWMEHKDKGRRHHICRLGKIWKKKSKTYGDFLLIELNGITYRAYPNKFNMKSLDCDYVICDDININGD